MAGGYGGLITAALAFHLAAAEIINETHGHVVLPIGTPAAPRITAVPRHAWALGSGRVAPRAARP